MKLFYVCLIEKASKYKKNNKTKKLSLEFTHCKKGIVPQIACLVWLPLKTLDFA